VTDPLWAERIFMFRRLVPPAVALADLPPVDLVTVSHSHYDHLDLATLRELEARFHPTMIVPAGVGAILAKAGIRGAVELRWWEEHRRGDLSVTLVPAHHWSRRSFLDTNRSLWGGFVFASPQATVYHAGDTAFSRAVFDEIRERFTPLDVAMLPIGAYDPVWFMRTQHVTPEEAGEAFVLLGARRLVPMHYGTFDMTDEPVSEPPVRLQTWLRGMKLDEERLWLLEAGETRALLQASYLPNK
jgi:L-ascorbate metabolism protein UlaG (beta-lactamase superfamily)